MTEWLCRQEALQIFSVEIAFSKNHQKPGVGSLALKGESFSVCPFPQQAVLEGSNGPCLGKLDSGASLKKRKSSSFIPRCLCVCLFFSFLGFSCLLSLLSHVLSLSPLPVPGQAHGAAGGTQKHHLSVAAPCVVSLLLEDCSSERSR